MRNSSSPLMVYVIVLGFIVLLWYVFGKAAANVIKEETAFADGTTGQRTLRFVPTPSEMRSILLDKQQELT